MTETREQTAKVISIREGMEEEKPKVRFPAQLNLFTSKPEPVRIPVEMEWDDLETPIGEGITLVKSDDKSQLIISGYGIFLSKVSERLTVKAPEKSQRVVYEFPFMRLSEVTVASRGVSLSSDLVEELCKRGISLHFMQPNGQPYGLITSPMLTATVQARREQIQALSDERGFLISQSIVEAKLHNQAALLQYFGKYLQNVDSSRFDEITQMVTEIKSLEKQVRALKSGTMEGNRPTLMGLEGTAGRLYWEGVKRIVAERTTFMGRATRGATDVVNALLNYGYGILYTQVWSAVILAGLEPFVGFLHVDRPGKPSLVLDLVEEFRQPVVDRAVIASINLGQNFEMEGGLLDAESRKTIAAKILDRLETRESFKGKTFQIRSIIQIQARNVASFLRGEKDYKPYRFKW